MLAAVGVAVCGAVVADASAEPSWAGAGAAPEPTMLGGFAIGDQIEGLVDPRTGALSFAIPVAGLAISWDSRARTLDRFALGGGWSIAGLPQVLTEGGTQVLPASGGIYEADDSVASGLAGYVLEDLVFVQEPGRVPARPDRLRGEQDTAFELTELGGIRTFFSAAGDPVVRIDANGNRQDWEWEPDHRLTRITDQEGVVSTLDWSDPARLTVTTAAGESRPVTAVIELDGGQVAAVVDPTGGRVQIGYTDSASVVRISGVSGATTEITWQDLRDGQRVVDHIRVVEAATGAELSTRAWDANRGLASGWPSHGGQVAPLDGDGARYETAVSDGATTVTSEFDHADLLLERDVSVTSAAGTLVVQHQAYTYPDRSGEALPPQYARPIELTVTHTDAAGGRRSVTERFAHDELGRLTSHSAADGTRTETAYDDSVPDGARVPIGLPVSQRVTAPDGLVEEVRHEVNPAHTAHVITETYAGTTADVELTLTGRSEFDVEADGFVSQERVFGQGGAAPPVVTTHTKQVDLARGTVATSTTVAAGTPAAATTAQLLDLLHGVPLEKTGAAGDVGSAAYDALGRVVEQTDAAGNQTRSEYRTLQQHGQNATVVTGPDGVVTTTTTDVLGRIVQLADNILDGVVAAGHERIAETRAYPGPGVVEVTDAWGATTTATQDAYGRTIRTTASNGLTELNVYDDVADTVTTAMTPTGDLGDAQSTTTTQLDTNGQVTEASGTRADGAPVPTVSHRYDGLGRAIETTDATGTTAVDLDVFGNPATTTITPDASAAPAGRVTPPTTATRRFDAFGASTAKTLAAGEEARQGGVLTHDALGRVRTRTDQDGGVTSTEYTVDGLVDSSVTSYGQATTNEYDDRTRALVRTATTSPIGATVTTEFAYDAVTGATVGVFDPADRAGTEVRSEYDAWGNPTRIVYPDGGTIEHAYDEHGRPTETTDIAGNTTRFEHDAVGLLIGATQTDAAGDELARVGYRYDDYGRVTELARGNGVTTAYRYTSANEVAEEVATRVDGTVVSERTYAYDARGHLTTRVDTRPSPETGAPITTTTAYRYDAYGRLIDSTVHDGPGVDAPARTTTSYELSVAGDIRAEHVTEHPGTDAEATTTRAFTYGATGTLLSVATTQPDGSVTTATQDYDAAGNLTRSLDGTTYAYDATNQPVTETSANGRRIETGYWATGRRASHTQAQDGSTSTTVFHWDGATLLNDTHTASGTSVTAAYLIGVGRHARTLGTPDSTRHFEADSHGNVTELTDAGGAVTTSYAYTDYGVATVRDHAGSAGAGNTTAPPAIGDSHRNPFQYAGEYTDLPGTQHLQERTYDPVSMRLTTVDPAPRHNRYHYADLNPIMLADPTGREPAPPTWVSLLLAGIGLLAAIVGVGAAALALSTAHAIAATAASTTATNIVLGAALTVAWYDLTFTALTLADEIEPTFLDDEVAFGLGMTSFLLGGYSMIAGLGARSFHRLDLDLLIGKFTIRPKQSETAARLILQKERGLARYAQRLIHAVTGQTHGADQLGHQLRKSVAARSSTETGNWMPGTHLTNLGTVTTPMKGQRGPKEALKVRVPDALGAKLRALRRAELVAAHLNSAEINAQLARARVNLIPDLRSVVVRRGESVARLYERGYEPGYRFFDSRGFAYYDDARFGTRAVVSSVKHLDVGVLKTPEFHTAQTLGLEH